MVKGNYYKIKTKKWFEEKGYQCEYLEKLQRIFTKDKKVIFIKKDLFSSDGLAINENEIIFWNSKLNKKNISQGYKNYSELKIPKIPQIKKWLIVWEKYSKEPEIIEVD